MKNCFLKRTLLAVFGLFTLLLFSCNPIKDPEFKTVRNLKIVSFTSSSVVLKGDAIFYNPNPVGVKLQSIDLDVFANSKKVSDIVQNSTVGIQAKSEFALPLQVKFAPEKFLDNWAGTILNTLVKKSIDIEITGDAKIVVVDKVISIPVKYDESLKYEP